MPKDILPVHVLTQVSLEKYLEPAYAEYLKARRDTGDRQPEITQRQAKFAAAGSLLYFSLVWMYEQGGAGEPTVDDLSYAFPYLARMPIFLPGEMQELRLFLLKMDDFKIIRDDVPARDYVAERAWWALRGTYDYAPTSTFAIFVYCMLHGAMPFRDRFLIRCVDGP